MGKHDCVRNFGNTNSSVLLKNCMQNTVTEVTELPVHWVVKKVITRQRTAQNVARIIWISGSFQGIHKVCSACKILKYFRFVLCIA